MVDNEENAFFGGFVCGLGLFTLIYFTFKIAECFEHIRDTRSRVCPAPNRRERELSSLNQFTLKMVVRTDIPLVKNKLSKCCAHAAVMAFDRLLTEDPVAARFWQACGYNMTLVAAESIDTIIGVNDLARSMNLITTFACDERESEIGPPIVTVIAIGPEPEDAVNFITDDLRIL